MHTAVITEPFAVAARNHAIPAIGLRKASGCPHRRKAKSPAEEDAMLTKHANLVDLPK